MRKKISDLVIAVSIVLLTMTTTFSAFQIYPVYGALNLRHSVIASSVGSTILTTLPIPHQFMVNVTSNGADYINTVDILLPATYTGASAVSTPAGWNPPTISNGWANYTAAVTDFKSGKTYSFTIQAQINVIPSDGTWAVDCYQGATASADNPATSVVTLSLEFSSTMQPNYVTDKSYIFTITTTNNYVSVGILETAITFPSNGGWVFNGLISYAPSTWIINYISSTDTFILMGPAITVGQTVTLQVNMTVNFPAGYTSLSQGWLVQAIDTSSNNLGTYTISAAVDNYVPQVTIMQPSTPNYSVGAGNYIWVNVSVTDFPSIDTYAVTVSVNDSRFQFYASQPWVRTDAQHYTYYFVNTTAISDGPLVLGAFAQDQAGNVGSGVASTTVDNTAPKLVWITIEDQYGSFLHQDSSGTFWMKASTLNVAVAAAFYNPANFAGYIYFNSTTYTFVNSTSGYSWLPGPTTSGYSVAGSNLVTLNITLTDGALPKPNRISLVWTISRDTVAPSAPTYYRITTICGGAIMWGLTATDNVGINNYNIYLNGSLFTLDPTILNSSTLMMYPYFSTIANNTIFNLHAWGYNAGDVANITIDAVDYGSNVGPVTTNFVTVLDGQWYPLVLYPKWNLISLPLIPKSTATADIYSLLLLNGAAGVKYTYTYDNVGKAWVLNPLSMIDGNGYWMYMNAYDVLIVQGFSITQPQGMPPPIEQYSLKQGWNLAGFTEVTSETASYYVASLQTTPPSYFRWLFAWDSAHAKWIGIDTLSASSIVPGQAFWVYTYSDQTLVPPP